MWKAATLLVCIYFLGVSRGRPYPDFLNVDLSKEVNCTSTDAGSKSGHLSVQQPAAASRFERETHSLYDDYRPLFF